MELVRQDFKQLELPIEIHIDALSKEEILNYIETTNFNRQDFLKTDYQNFKKYLNTDSYPRHMDYLNSDCAPDLMRFINSKISGKKNFCYYNFLRKIEEENIPFYNDSEIAFLSYLSDLLPIVRPDEFVIIKELMNGDKTKIELIEAIKKDFIFKTNQFDNALEHLQNKFMSDNDKKIKPLYIKESNNHYYLDFDLSNSLYDDVLDLLNYGLERFKIEFGNFDNDLKLFGNYTTAQLMLATNHKTKVYMKGTKIEGDKGYILAGLKKDANTEERLNYKDKFLSKKVFQWESETGCTLTNGKGLSVLRMKTVDIFVRKVSEEDGITLPFTYIGKGRLTNPRESDNPGKTLLFDIVLDNEIPDYLKFDFNVPEEKKEI